ncbi:hypothetical protein [Nonomuraea basaltis]|uniref:hypothetical protein n=1 Tax=Nonomuraea basaltis TaxID=2495887 RepID=UPI00110C572F|nr:hypothetical protein [Nonomuraea basaltis]TMR94867.1 hypothetical protein EJK15_31645 [Nonomuraea basaltis]
MIQARDITGPPPTGGPGGVGKTALAVHAAHRALDSFPGGVLFADLQGYDEARRVDPSRVLDGWLRALGVSGAGVLVHGLTVSGRLNSSGPNCASSVRKPSSRATTDSEKARSPGMWM